MRIETIIKQYDFNLAYAQALVEDVHEDKMTFVPSVGLENHAAFTLGHLVSASAMLVEDLGGKFEMPENWEKLFIRKGPGDTTLPHPNKQLYPSKEALLFELEHQHEKVKRSLLSLNEAKLNEPFTWRFNRYFPSLLDLVVFMCLQHEAMHLGQLAAWRRAMGYTSALATL